jgi:prefoldin subunit 5
MLSLDQVTSIVQLLVILGGGAYFIWSMQTGIAVLTTRQAQIDERLVKIEASIDRLSSTTVEIARQDERVNHVEARLQELSNRIHAITDIQKSRRRAG